MKIGRHSSNGKANFPFVVQVQNTENWNSTEAFEVELDAVKYAEQVAQTFPTFRSVYTTTRADRCEEIIDGYGGSL